jgi:hypothetical protein
VHKRRHRVFADGWLVFEIVEEKPSGWGMFPGFAGDFS